MKKILSIFSLLARNLLLPRSIAAGAYYTLVICTLKFYSGTEIALVFDRIWADNNCGK
jgi:hypothetical protein